MKSTTAQEVIILIGIPASGKTTFRKEFLKENTNYIGVSRDDFRYMLRNVGWEPQIEDMVTQVVNQTIVNALQNGRSVIVDATHCNEKAFNNYSSLKTLFPVKIRCICIDVDLDTAIIRDGERERSVGPTVIEKMYNDLQKFKATDRFKQLMNTEPIFAPVVQDPELRRAVIFDIDGTLAKINPVNGRSPFDWKRVGEDLPMSHVINVLDMYRMSGASIILMSGRDCICRPETEAWLEAMDIQYDVLYMRPQGSMEKDSIIKNRLFIDYVLPNYFTEVIYDDRNQVVNTWRQMGLNCFQVAEGNF